MSNTDIANYINTLATDYHILFFEIVKQNNIPYTENNNGVFINMYDVPIHLFETFSTHVEKYNLRVENPSIINNTVDPHIAKEIQNEDDNNIYSNKSVTSKLIENISNSMNASFQVDEKDYEFFEKEKQKILKKNVHMKFNVAIKKYLKISSSENKKTDLNMQSILYPEEYLF